MDTRVKPAYDDLGRRELDGRNPPLHRRRTADYNPPYSPVRAHARICRRDRRRELLRKSNSGPEIVRQFGPVQFNGCASSAGVKRFGAKLCSVLLEARSKANRIRATAIGPYRVSE